MEHSLKLKFSNLIFVIVLLVKSVLDIISICKIYKGIETYVEWHYLFNWECMSLFLIVTSDGNLHISYFFSIELPITYQKEGNLHISFHERENIIKMKKKCTGLNSLIWMERRVKCVLKTYELWRAYWI